MADSSLFRFFPPFLVLCVRQKQAEERKKVKVTIERTRNPRLSLLAVLARKQAAKKVILIRKRNPWRRKMFASIISFRLILNEKSFSLRTLI
jgi:hypothetical protein